MKELLFSITAKDCDFDYYVGSGKGGQKRNKTANCVRCTHRDSGAVGKSENGRSQRKNKEAAFKTMALSDRFKAWHRIETSRKTGQRAEIYKNVDREMKHIKVESKNAEGKWAEVTTD